MNPEEWIGKSFNIEKKLSPEPYQSFNECMGRTDAAVEEGGSLPPYGHWFYFTEGESGRSFLPSIQNGNYFWREGTLELESALRVGDHCQMNVQLTDFQKVPENQDSFIIHLNQNFRSNGKRIASEEHQILFEAPDHESDRNDIRKISFDPDWIQKVDSNQTDSLKKLSSQLAGQSIADLFAETRDSGPDQDTITLGGPPALVLLLDAFDYHFDSRAASRISYKASALTPAEGPLQIAGRDSDSYVTDLYLLNSNNQVLFSAGIRWSSTWGTSRF